MGQKNLFDRTRRQIATWYGIGMGLLLILTYGYSYWMIDNSYRSGVDRELQSVAGTIHDSLEPELSEPGIINQQIDAAVLPHLCIVGTDCRHSKHLERHVLGISQQSDYYLKLYNHTEQVIAYFGTISANASGLYPAKTLLSFQDEYRHPYRRIVIALKNVNGQAWGFLEVGHSLADLDERLAKLRWEFAIAFPGFILLIGCIGWCLVGRTMQPIYQSYQKMQQFTADASHELRTPLTALQATVELVRNYQSIDSSAAAKSLAVLDRQTERLIQLTQDLLLLSRLDEPQAIAKIPIWTISPAIQEIITGFRALSDTQGIRLMANLQDNIWVRIDRTHLEQLMSNLILNAIEHTSPQGTITIVLQRLGHSAILEVSDTGQGMPLEVQHRVFDRFYRASKNRDSRAGRLGQHQKGGTGLGLAIVHSIVESYGGSIEVRSKLHQGSTFLIKLPLG